jgi:ABC-type polysaccharide/polyol phosphate transport system ATPase subunit
VSEIAIQASGLGKRYALAHERGPRRAHAAIDRTLRNLFRGQAGAEAEHCWAVRDCSFTIGRGEVVALLGWNGAGKSVLLKILARVTKPSTGWAEIRGRLVSLLEVGSGFHPELTGRENIYLSAAILGVKRAAADRKFDEIVEFSEIGRFLDTPVRRYSSGMYMRLAFSVAWHLDADVMLIDEVLAVGDERFQNKCMDRISSAAERGVTILLVSHDMGTVGRLCQRGLYLESGTIRYDGPVAGAIERYHRGEEE